MVDPFSFPSFAPNPMPSTSAPRVHSEPARIFEAVEDHAGDVVQFAGGVADEFRERFTPELESAASQVRTEIEFREMQLARVESRYRELVREGGDELATEAAAGNLRIETKGIIAAQNRQLELAELEKADARVSAIGDAVGMTFAVKDLIDGEQRVREYAQTDPRAAWREALRTAFGVVADGASPLSKFSRGGMKGALGDIGLGAAMKKLGERIADATFDPINRFAHFIAEKPWWPKNRAPREPLERGIAPDSRDRGR